MTSASAIRRRVAERLFPGVGCTDGNCVYGRHDGMHTNGGCHCLDDKNPFHLRAVARQLASVAQTLAAIVEDES
jgi:hypothetical protein